MQVEIKIDSSVTEPKVIVLTSRMTDEVSELVSRLSEPEPQTLAGFREGTVSILDQDKLLRIYAEGGKVIAAAEDGEYTLRLRLYELEPRLRRDFVRISNSEIINLKKAKRFDLSMSGTICVSMSDGSVSYVSRRYVSKIKTVLGL
ncbi:MAG: LytTR family transcriptional regulator [Oscillospiraceae bacterium]|nr:LytTR family transcriptional regulator [Oscillospiraceae bacterium]MBQ1768776.1 LytTR family transcriptional regulator [Oscillospiraceae bacterium]MBQ2057082.1 LytTR family transcriptional regulator [Oscillospiraceae bacterium]MBQ2158147.1 LytTR family transcriptional regulator [Oscillospiraceae bacterium]MBQ2230976.1 LytTR family transcriptional regulator [Oscillospiraceae bacterium]